MADERIHHDLFGNQIEVGSYVVSYGHSCLEMFVVEKLNPKMVSIRRARSSRKPILRYPRDLVVIDNEKAVFKLLSS